MHTSKSSILENRLVSFSDSSRLLAIRRSFCFSRFVTYCKSCNTEAWYVELFMSLMILRDLWRPFQLLWEAQLIRCSLVSSSPANWPPCYLQYSKKYRRLGHVTVSLIIAIDYSRRCCQQLGGLHLYVSNCLIIGHLSQSKYVPVCFSWQSKLYYEMA